MKIYFAQCRGGNVEGSPQHPPWPSLPPLPPLAAHRPVVQLCLCCLAAGSAPYNCRRRPITEHAAGKAKKRGSSEFREECVWGLERRPALAECNLRIAKLDTRSQWLWLGSAAPFPHAALAGTGGR